MNEKLDEITQLKALAEAGALRLSRALEGKIPDELEKKHEQLLSKGVTEEELAKTEYENFIEESVDLVDENEKYYDKIKGIVKAINYIINYYKKKEKAKNENIEYMHPGRTADIFIDDLKVGYVGEVHEAVLKNYEINKTF